MRKHALYILLVGLLACTAHADTTPRSVALMCRRPVTGGWHALSQDDGFLYAAGTILAESLEQIPALALMPWKDTAGIRGIIDSGLYSFQSETGHARWGELLRADVFVELDLDEQRFRYAIHTRDGSTEGGSDAPSESPREVIAEMVTAVVRAAGVSMPEVVKSQLAEAETDDADMFMLWAVWDNFHPSPYAMDENPWGRPSAAAQKLVNGDSSFKRGLGWALPMLLKPVEVRNKAGKRRAANPPLFDMNVLRVLDSRFAERVIPHYNKRLKEDRFLFKNSVGLLRVEGRTLDFALDAVDDDGLGDGLATGMSGEAFKEIKATPGIRRSVCLALSGIENTELIERLKDLVSEDPNVDVRIAATTSLGGFKVQPMVMEAIGKATADKEPEVRLAAYRALTRLGRQDTDAFRSGLKDADATVKWYVKSALIEASPEQAPQLVLEVTGSDDPAMRRFGLEMAPRVFKSAEKIQGAIESGLKSTHDPETAAALGLIDHYDLRQMAGHLPDLFPREDPSIRARALELSARFAPEQVTRLADTFATDASEEVQTALLDAIAEHGGKASLATVRSLLDSPWADVRQRASDTVYRLQAGDRDMLVKAMLADPSMRVNVAGLRTIARRRTPALLAELSAVVRAHPNEHVRSRALVLLDEIDDPRVVDEARRALKSPFFVVRLFAAAILSRRADPAHAADLDAALRAETHEWLKPVLEDALAAGRGEEAPERTRLNLGERAHTEGGELANGIQLWLGNLGDDDEESRRLVDEGYRFGRVLPAPPDQSMWAMRTWNDGKGKRNTYLLHVLDSITKLDARFLHYYCMFDEPHLSGGGDGADIRRAFFLEIGRPDLLEADSIPDELRGEWRYFSCMTLTELSNWGVAVVRNTLQRRFQDLQIFPQTLSYMGGAAVQAWDMLDGDGDYSWRYDYHNIMGHYGKGAVTRALRRGQPTYMVTRIGTYNPFFFRLDEIYTSTKFRPGPWDRRSHLATCAGLALYASGTEVGYFNHVSFKSMAMRGHGTGGTETYPLMPWSDALSAIINRMITGDKKYYWDKVRSRIEMKVLKKYEKEDDIGGEDVTENDVDDALFDLEDTDEKIKTEIGERYDAAVHVHFTNTMIGCSWMNIFNADNSRAMANLPKPDRSPRPTLVILGCDSRYNSDGATFPSPAIALAYGFDLVPAYSCMDVVDLSRYDTIILRGSRYGVTGTMVNKLNEWMMRRRGLLIVNGEVKGGEALFPELIADPPTAELPWENAVTVTAYPLETLQTKDRRGKVRERQVGPIMGTLVADGAECADDLSRVRWHYDGAIEPIATRDGLTVLARWKAPDSVKATVLFDGGDEAGPVYTEILEAAVLASDKARNASIRRNRWWGHVGLETDQFVIDVATRGYKALQAARPRQHKGIDIIYGVVDPEVQHNTSTLILRDYVGPYAGSLGDWAVMARSELISMKAVSPARLNLHTRGVVRVTHAGPKPIRLADTDGSEEVEGQLDVWKLMWQGSNAWCRVEIDGGWELHYQSLEPVVVEVE